jgi:hypothetical protein
MSGMPSADRQRGQTRPAESPRPQPAVAAAEGHQADAEAQDADAGRGERRHRLAQYSEGGERREERRAAARDRVDLPHIGLPVGLRQGEVVAEMQDDRAEQPGP